MKNLRRLFTWGVVSFFTLIFFSACGEEATVSTSLSPSPTPPTRKKGSSAEEKAVQLFEGELHKKLAKDLNKPARIRMLPVSTLYKTIHEVPEQTTPWGCGNQQVMQAVAIAHSGLGEKIPAIVKECNVMGDYPALVNIEITKNLKPLLAMANLVGFSPDLETIGNKSYFTCGSLAQNATCLC